MFAKKDYENYFMQIKKIESDMLGIFSELVDTVSDKELKSVLREIKEDELEHKEIVEKMLKLIK